MSKVAQLAAMAAGAGILIAGLSYKRQVEIATGGPVLNMGIPAKFNLSSVGGQNKAFAPTITGTPGTPDSDSVRWGDLGFYDSQPQGLVV